MKKLIRPNIEKIKPYIPGKPIDEVARELGLKTIYKMASNENALGASPKAILAMKENLDKVFYYPDGSAYSLKKKLSEKLGFSTDHFILGNGSNDVIEIIAKAFLCPDDEIILSDQAFVVYKLVAALMDVKTTFVALKNYTHDLKAMADKVTSRTKLIVICNPNNPTGTMNDKHEFAEFMKSIPESVMVVVDEAYYEYVTREDYPDSLDYLKAGRNIIVLRTFSKIYGLAGLRIGYGISKPEFILEMNKIRQPFNVNSLAQVAAIAALDDDEHIRRSRENNINGLLYLTEELTKLGFDYVPSSANFILIDVKTSSKDVFNMLMKKGIIVRPMEEYGFPHHIRVTVGRLEENQRFIEAIKN